METNVIKGIYKLLWKEGSKNGYIDCVPADKSTSFIRVAAIYPCEKDFSNAELVTEAFNVANETGLTPRQLLEQRNELLEVVKMAKEWFDFTHNKADNGQDYFDIAKIESAIKKITGE